MDLRLNVYFYRIISALLESSAVLVFIFFVVRLLGTTESFALYSIFFSSACLMSYVISLGQDRLLLVLLSKFKEESSSKNENEYLVLLTSLCLVYIILLLLAGTTFYFTPSHLIHPVLLGICFSPFLAFFQLSCSLMNVAGRPVIARYINILIMLLFQVPTFYLYKYMTGSINFISIAYIILIFVTLTGIINFIISIKTFRFFDDTVSGKQTLIREYESLTNNTANISHGIVSLISLMFNVKHSHEKELEWLRKGIPIALSRINDNIYNLIVPLLYFSNISLSTIAFLSVALFLKQYICSLSFVIRNHFLPTILSLLTSNEDASHPTYDQLKNMRSINTVIWLSMILLTIVLLIIAPYLLASYGPEYTAAYPMVIATILLSFLPQGWAFHRGVFVVFDDLEKILFRSQLTRFFVIMACSFISIFWTGNIYWVIFSVGIPSVLCFFFQLSAYYRKTRVFLLFP
jgi:hypothetical protein